MKLDLFNHIFPRPYFERMTEVCHDRQTLKRYVNIPMLLDLDVRFRAMDRPEGYRQILSLASPPIELLAGPEETPELARRANDGLAELCRRYPDRFPGFVAALPMNQVDASAEELRRAIEDLGAVGVQVYTNVAGKPLDAPEFAFLFTEMAERCGVSDEDRASRGDDMKLPPR